MFKVIFNHPKRVWGRFKINIFLLHTKAKPVIMNRITFLLALLLPVTLFSQKDNDKKENHSIGIGIRGGLNFANVTPMPRRLTVQAKQVFTRVYFFRRQQNRSLVQERN
jgi:hypothetical protein